MVCHMRARIPDESAEMEAVESARRRLRDVGAEALPRPPWSPPGAPPDDATLIAFVVWRANMAVGDASPAEIRAALRLLDSARSNMDALESAVLLIARAEGLTWPEIASELGVRSPQAAQQRAQRVSSRASSDDRPGGGER